MKSMARVFFVLAGILTAGCFLLPLSATAQEYPVLVDGEIAGGTGFGIGIDDAKGHRNWLAPSADSLELKYPGNLGWASLFITVGGDAVRPPRPFQDFSLYKKIQIEMKGASGGECVQVGVKDENDPDDGTEPKKSTSLTTAWKTYEFALSDFANRPSNRSSLNLDKLYVVSEFVFPCGPTQNQAQTVYVKNIKFVR